MSMPLCVNGSSTNTFFMALERKRILGFPFIGTITTKAVGNTAEWIYTMRANQDTKPYGKK
jgi:hypothetical protein